MLIGEMTILKLMVILSCIVKMVELKKKAGNTVSYSSEVTVCNDELSKNLIKTSELRAKRYNETIGVLAGPFEFKKRVDGKIKIDWLIEKILPGGGKELILTYEVTDFCKEIKERFSSDNLAGQYYRAINFTAECPLEAGIYYIDNMVADIKQLPIDHFLQGGYTVTFTFYSYETTGSDVMETTGLKRLGCLYFDCTIEPKA